MKDYFKYEFGYVNKDDQALYLTHTGNWSEVEEMKQKPPKAFREGFRKARILFFMIVVGLLFLVMTLGMLKTGTVSLIWLGLIGAGSYFIYRYFQRELGKLRIIPLHAITGVDIQDKQATIHYANTNKQTDTITLTRVEQKGLEILKDLVTVYTAP